MADKRILTPDEVLQLVPQQPPFRFIDEILEMDDEHILASYRWDPASDFYRGHFPDNPVTPGVIMIESMAQCGMVPLALFLTYKEYGESEAQKFQTIFTECNVEFTGMARPGDRVLTLTKRVYWRRKKLKADVEMKLEDGTVICAGQLAGIGVMK
ncbi:MAG: beta-hydroxyacyl-ACP dehydratase [bacterium]|nr:beta-hydroxyacyl-ACP dehydratase [bacterium]